MTTTTHGADCSCTQCHYQRKHPQLRSVGVRAALAEIEVDAKLAPYGGDPLKKLAADNIRTWLEIEAIKEGTDRQRDLYLRGELPEDEMLTIARAVLFKGFGKFSRWAKSHALVGMAKDLRHAVFCKLHTTKPEIAAAAVRLNVEGMVGFEDAPFDANEATSVELSNLKSLRECAEAAQMHPWLVRTDGTVRVEPITHWLYCTCEAETARSSARVVIKWGERELVREYAL